MTATLQGIGAGTALASTGTTPPASPQPSSGSAVTATTTANKDGSTRTDVHTKDPSWLYPKNRGKPSQTWFDPSIAKVPIPGRNALGGLTAAVQIPDVGQLVPRIDPSSLLPHLAGAIPKLPLGGVSKTVSSLLGPLDQLPAGILNALGSPAKAISAADAAIPAIHAQLDGGDWNRPRNHPERVRSDIIRSGNSSSASPLSTINSLLGVNSGSQPIAFVGQLQVQAAAVPASQPVAFPFQVLPGDLILASFDTGGALTDVQVADLGTTRPAISYSSISVSPHVKAYVAPPSSTLDPNSQGAVLTAALTNNPGGSLVPVGAYDISFVVYRNAQGIARTATASSGPGQDVTVSLPSPSASTSVNIAVATGSDLALSPTPIGFTPRTTDDPVNADNTGLSSAYVASFTNIGSTSAAAAMFELTGPSLVLPSPGPLPPVPPSPPPTPGPLPNPGPIPPTGSQPIFFHLHTESAGVAQDFDLPLCTPSAIDVASTNTLTPTTTVSLCPIPLALTTTTMLPPLSQPAQLYLSVQRIPGTCACSALFSVSYTVPGINGSSFTVNDALDTRGPTAYPYPNNAILGDATDYNPVSGGDINHVTMGWAMDGQVDSIMSGAVGVATMQINQLPAGSGSFAVSKDHDKYTAQLTDTNPLPPGSNPSVVLSASRFSTSSNAGGRVVWSNVPQDFTFNITPDAPNDQPTGLTYDGSQTMNPNPNFAVEFDLLAGGQTTGLVQQNGFGQNLSETVQLLRDQNNNLTGVEVRGNPGATSTMQLVGYDHGQMAGFVELVGIQPLASDVHLEMTGTASDANLGMTATGSDAPAFVGASTYYQPNGGLSSTPLASMLLNVAPASPPIAVSPGSMATVTVNGLNPTFTLSLKDAITGEQAGQQGAATFHAEGTAGTGVSADQLRIDAVPDGNHRVTILFNHLGSNWKYDLSLHGTLENPTGATMADSEINLVPNEYKEVYVVHNTGSGWTSEATLQIMRGGSDTSGAIPAAGEVLTDMDPPTKATLTFDLTQSSGTCNQKLTVSGNDTDASNGTLTFSAGAQSIVIAGEFVLGQWNAVVSSQGATPSQCGGYDFQMSQGAGANPAGSISASGPLQLRFLNTPIDSGTVSLQGLATTTHVALAVNPLGHGWSGLSVSGSNSSNNPSLQIHLDGTYGGATVAAVNLWSSGGGTQHTGSMMTAVVSSIPQVFGMDIEEAMQTTGGREFKLSSHNAADQPSEQVFINAAMPADQLLPTGGTAQVLAQSFDATSSMDIHLLPGAGDGLSGEVTVANSGANPTQLISAELIDPYNNLIYNLLLTGPSANAGSLPTGSWNGTLLWQSMPTDFDITVDGSGSGTSASLGFTIKGATQDSASVLTLQDTRDNATLVVNGTGVAQQFSMSYAAAQLNNATFDAKGTLPAGFLNLQAYRVWSAGSFDDAVFTVYRDGSLAQGWDFYGTDIEIDPVAGQNSFDVSANLQGTSAHLQTTSDTPGWGLAVAQYFDPNNGAAPCPSGGTNYPCAALNFWRTPVTTDLKAIFPTTNSPKATLDYSGSDNNLSLRVQTLTQSWQADIDVNGLPNGTHIDGTIDMNNGVSFNATTATKTPFPYMYFAGNAIPMPMVGTRSCQLDGAQLGLADFMHATAIISPSLNYTGDAVFTVNPGATRVIIQPVPASCGVFTGLEGVRVDGTGSGVGVGLSLGLAGANSLSWEWDAMVGSLILESDSDTFTWNEDSQANWADGWVSSYAWEVNGNDTTNRWGATGCGQPWTYPDQAGWHWWNASVPFQPMFPEVNNGLVVCAGHVAYYQLNPQGVLFEHCSDWGVLFNCPAGSNPSGTTRYSNVNFGIVTTDWLLAAAMKDGYGPTSDPAGLSQLSAG